jgi:hypothetical protein
MAPSGKIAPYTGQKMLTVGNFLAISSVGDVAGYQRSFSDLLSRGVIRRTSGDRNGYSLPLALLLFAARAKYTVVLKSPRRDGFSIIAFGDLERVIVTIGCATGSLLVSIVGMRLWRKGVNLRVELNQISARLTELERAESLRLLEKVRSQDRWLNGRLEPGEIAKAEDDPRRELLDTGEAQTSIRGRAAVSLRTV